MLLRTRLTVMFALAAGMLSLTFVAALAVWQRAEQARVDRIVLAGQQTIWRQFETAALQPLRAAAVALAADPRLGQALGTRDGTAIRAAAASLLRGSRVDVFDTDGAIVYTSSARMAQELQLDFAAVRQVLDAGRSVAGLMPVGADAFSFVAAVPLWRRGRVIGGIAVGRSADAGLLGLSQGLVSPVALVDLRSHAVGGNALALYNSIDPDLALRRADALELGYGGHEYRIAGLPVNGPDARQVASFVTLEDVSAERARERRWLAGLGAAALLIVAATLAALFAHQRRSFLPLSRVVEVLTALSRGDTSVRIDAERSDEAGLIAMGVARLRGEMIDLDILRDERRREHRRQEAIIRDELRGLAGTLEDAEREDILCSLQAAAAESQDAEGGRLTMLTFVLGRLSQHIREQHGRLRRLIEELNEALRTKQAFAFLQQELEIARRMQLSVLPRVFPDRPDVSLASLIRPAREVGGDFYDYFPLADGRIGLVIADVSGKGVPAAFFMAICRTLLKVSARFIESPAEVLARVNHLLAAENEEMMFVTLFYAVLDPSSGELVYASGGHNSPALRSGEEVRLLAPPGGMALAVSEEVPFGEGRVRLQAGDLLFLYTDGITEAQDPQGTLFGEAALLATLARLPGGISAATCTAGVLEAVERFMAGAPQADDITCLAVRFAGAAAAA